MPKNLFFLLIFILPSCLIHCEDDEIELPPLPFKNMLDTQKRLYKKIFKNYDKTVSPIIKSLRYQQAYNSPEYNNIYYGWMFWITVNQMKVIDLDEPQELFTTSVNILVEWEDVRLQWNDTQYDYINSIFVRQDAVWSPPLGVFSASDVKDHRDHDFRLVEVFTYGWVSTFVTMRLTTNCGLNMADFPFDIQTCELHLGLSSVNYDLYNFTIAFPVVEENICDMRNSAWDIVDISTGTLELYRESRIGVVRVVLKRNPIFYMYMIILPTFTINMIAIGGVFLKKSTQMEKLTIGFTHIMTMTFILGLVSEKIPKTSEIPLLGKYIVFGLCMMIFSLIISSGFDRFRVTKTNNRRYLAHRILKNMVVSLLQFLNILAFSYMIYRFLKFESKYGNTKGCDSENNVRNYSKYENMTSQIYKQEDLFPYA